jgi:hypothetical protein
MIVSDKAPLSTVVLAYAADLRHFHVPIATQGKAEPVLADTRAGMENHAVSDNRMGDGRAGTNVAITAERDPESNHGTGCNCRSVPNRRFPVPERHLRRGLERRDGERSKCRRADRAAGRGARR